MYVQYVYIERLCMRMCIAISTNLVVPSTLMFMYVCMHVCMCVCVCVCMYVFSLVYMYVCMYVSICMYVCICVCVCVCVVRNVPTHMYSIVSTRIFSLTKPIFCSYVSVCVSHTLILFILTNMSYVCECVCNYLRISTDLFI